MEVPAGGWFSQSQRCAARGVDDRAQVPAPRPRSPRDRFSDITRSRGPHIYCFTGFCQRSTPHPPRPSVRLSVGSFAAHSAVITGCRKMDIKWVTAYVLITDIITLEGPGARVPGGGRGGGGALSELIIHLTKLLVCTPVCGAFVYFSPV